MNRETLTAAIQMLLHETPECLDRAIAEFQDKGHCEVCFYFDSNEEKTMTFIKPKSHRVRCASAAGECLMSSPCVNECQMGSLAGGDRL